VLPLASSSGTRKHAAFTSWDSGPPGRNTDKYFTIWAILAHVTFCSTCIANSMIELDKGALDLHFGLLGINSLFGCKSASCGLLERSSSCTGLDRSDRSGVTADQTCTAVDSSEPYAPISFIHGTLYFLEASFDFLRVELPHLT
jgi:hypothetical protein